MGDFQHNFGGIWTVDKLGTLQKYLRFFTKALQNEPFKLFYIDAFAGSGECTVLVHGEEKTIIGSAKLAIDIKPNFDKLFFIEKSSKRYSELNTLKKNYPDRDIHLFNNDANEILPTIIDSYDRVKFRGVVFLDPYGMNTKWGVLEAIANTESLDLWYLFPLEGFFRQATIDLANMDSSKRNALTRLLGTDQWETDIYNETRQIDMFDGPSPIRRNTDPIGLAQYAKKRLETVFPNVTDPLFLPFNNNKKKFALFFAASNPNPKAFGLAMRGANYILKAAATG